MAVAVKQRREGWVGWVLYHRVLSDGVGRRREGWVGMVLYCIVLYHRVLGVRVGTSCAVYITAVQRGNSKQ